MWAIVGTLVTSLLPMLIKLVVYFIDKKNNNEKMREEFLRFLTSIETEIPTKVRDRYLSQIERIKAQIEASKQIEPPK
jgi:hypothetical protein